MRKILRKPAVQDIIGLSGKQIDCLESAGKFPRRVIITPNAVGWFDDEIEQFVESRQRGIPSAPEAALAAKQASKQQGAA